MKKIVAILILLTSLIGYGQTFNSVIPSTIDLTGASGSCAAPGIGTPNLQSINVSGLGVLSATFALQEISVTVDNSCTGSSANLNNLQFRIQAPDGTCSAVYWGGLSTLATGTHVIKLVSPVGCVNSPNSSNSSGNSNVTGNAGYYAATDNFGATVNLSTLFSGKNPNGTWYLIFSENTTSEPCLVATSITFGNPAVVDETANGEDCISAINWNGKSICASTTGKSGSVLMPGSMGGPTKTEFGTISGSTCGWNGVNNNDTWIKFTATSTSVCIGISGIDLDLQSIVVTDANSDGDNNPCTTNVTLTTASTNDPRWTLVSCPRNNIYPTTAGSSLNQNHCFAATAGKVYYLVVDGNGGLESSFYVNSTYGVINTLPIELVSFKGNCNGTTKTFTWQTASETNNNYFTLEHSKDAVEYSVISNVNGSGTSTINNSYSTSFTESEIDFKYYRLKQTDYDGKYTYSNIISVECNGELPVYSNINLYPNPTNNQLNINLGLTIEGKYFISIRNVLGQEIKTINYFKSVNNDISIFTDELSNGIYFLKINDVTNKIAIPVMKFVIEK